MNFSKLELMKHLNKIYILKIILKDIAKEANNFKKKEKNQDNMNYYLKKRQVLLDLKKIILKLHTMYIRFIHSLLSKIKIRKKENIKKNIK